MFIIGNEIKERIDLISSEIAEKSGGRIVFEEYIALPEFGRIVLRYDLKCESCTLDELEGYELMMRETAKEDFQVNFMGSVYKKAGITYEMMQERFVCCYERYSSEVIAPSVYAQKLRDDAGFLLRLCGMPEDAPVWEIQVESEKEFGLLVFGDQAKPTTHHEADGLSIDLSHVDRNAMEGLQRAFCYAIRNKISMARAILEA